jgi:hypothetical protein
MHGWRMNSANETQSWRWMTMPSCDQQVYTPERVQVGAAAVDLTIRSPAGVPLVTAYHTNEDERSITSRGPRVRPGFRPCAQRLTIPGVWQPLVLDNIMVAMAVAIAKSQCCDDSLMVDVQGPWQLCLTAAKTGKWYRTLLVQITHFNVNHLCASLVLSPMHGHGARLACRRVDGIPWCQQLALKSVTEH